MESPSPLLLTFLCMGITPWRFGLLALDKGSHMIHHATAGIWCDINGALSSV